MSDKKVESNIAALARLCGISLGYEDNFGTCRQTSRAALEALLTAMGVPCGSPGEIRDSLEQGR
ncbi:MAG: hypothetical protein WAU47_10170, partial [Desulfobaccales bacterium]